MARTADRAHIAAASAEVIRPCIVARLGLASGDVWLTTSDHDLRHDFGDGSGAVLVYAVGDLGKVSPINEGGTPESRRLTMTLSGLRPAFVATALGEAYQGRPVQLWKCLVGDDYSVTAAQPLYFGVIDTMDIDIGGEALITLTVNDWLERWHRPIGGKMSDEDQKARSPGDNFFSKAATLDDRRILFGRKG